MWMKELIDKKRRGQLLSAQEIEFLVKGITQGQLSDAQVAAFAMAVCCQGMAVAEQVALTRAMRDSGSVLDWRDMHLDGPLLDKHSTGGVGDLTSLVLAPMLAACGAYVPMISGRGLGHTGGTLDKLEAIPGFRTCRSTGEFKTQVKQTGLAIVEQSSQLAPADKRLYAIRDNAACVESAALIQASILSKKLAAGIQYLLLDVKQGNGAFMPDTDNAAQLASLITQIAQQLGLSCAALVTDMNQVFSASVGHSLEVQEALDFLTGQRRASRLLELCLALGERLLCLSGLQPTPEQARVALMKALDSQEALERFAAMIHAAGGPADFVERAATYLPQAPIQLPVYAGDSGYVQQMDCRKLGISLIGLGGGRVQATDCIDHSVGLSELCQVGTFVDSGRPLAVIHARHHHQAEKCRALLLEAIKTGPQKPAPHSIILGEVGQCHGPSF